MKKISSSSYSRDEIRTITQIGNKSEISITKLNNEVSSNNLEKRIELKEPNSVVNFECETEKISVLESEQDMNLKMTLDTKGEDKNLYKNAKFVITFPSEFTKVELNQVNMVYANGLEIEKYNLVTNENGVATTNKLNIGKYSIREVETIKNYELDNNEHKIEILNHGDLIDLEMCSSLQQIDLENNLIENEHQLAYISNAINYPVFPIMKALKEHILTLSKEGALP